MISYPPEETVGKVVKLAGKYFEIRGNSRIFVR